MFISVLTILSCFSLNFVCAGVYLVSISGPHKIHSLGENTIWLIVVHLHDSITIFRLTASNFYLDFS